MIAPGSDDSENNQITPVSALVVGNGEMARSLRRQLTYRNLNSTRVDSPLEINLSLAPEFIFWIPPDHRQRLPETMVNMATAVAAKLTIVSTSGDDCQPILTDGLARGVDARLVVLHDLYGPGILKSPLALIWSHLPQQQIRVPENDSLRIAPLFIDDAALGACLAAFSAQTYGKSLHLCGPEEMTIVNFVYRLRETVARVTGKLPQIVIDPQFNLPSLAHYQKVIAAREAFDLLSLTPPTRLADGIKRVAVAMIGRRGLGIGDRRGEDPTSEKPQPHESNNRRRRKWPRHLATFGVMLLVILPSIFTLAVALAQFSANQLAAAVFDSSRKDNLWLSPADEQYARLVRALLPISSIWHQALRRPERTGEVTELLNQAQRRLDSRPLMDRVAVATVALGQAAVEMAAMPVDSAISQLDQAITQLLPQLGLLAPVTSGTDPTAEIRRSLSLVRELLPVIRWAAGVEGKTTLLVVMQNSSEIRPTGGFISSVAFATFDKGKLLDLATTDIYQIDSQLLGIQDPPPPIRTLLGESSWLARDANWSADAPTAANHISRVISRSTGRKVDGVVFMTTRGLSTILSFTGPITTASGEIVSADNLIERSVFNPGSQLPSDPQSDRLAQVVEALAQLRGDGEIIRLGQGLMAALQQEELLITSRDENIAAVLGQLGVDGAVKTPECAPLITCVPSSIYVVDANLGINQADYFMQRTRQVEVFIPQGSKSVEAVVTLTYRNGAPNNVRPAGSYRGYTRIYTPISGTIASAVVISPGQRVELATDHEIEFAKHVTGFYLDIPPQAEKTVELRFSVPFVSRNQLARYSLLMQKQPGIGEVPTRVIFHYPSEMVPMTILPQTTNTDGKIVFTADGQKSQTFSAQFAAP